MSYSLKKRRAWNLGSQTVVIVAWLFMALQSCAIAAEQHPTDAGNDRSSTAANLALVTQASVSQEAPCCPPVSCHTLDTENQTVSQGMPIQLDTPDIQPLLRTVEYPFKRATQSSPWRSQQADYLPPHPLVRFCVLRI